MVYIKKPKYIELCILLSKKDIEEIKESYLKGLTFHYVKNITDVLKIALTDEKVKNAIDIK